MRDYRSGKCYRHWVGVIFAHLHLDVVSRTETVLREQPTERGTVLPYSRLQKREQFNY